jgi:deoxyribose-phosphate aldolase
MHLLSYIFMLTGGCIFRLGLLASVSLFPLAPEDITARLDNIDQQLEQLGDEIDLIPTIQNGNRREIRATSQTAASRP